MAYHLKESIEPVNLLYGRARIAVIATAAHLPALKLLSATCSSVIGKKVYVSTQPFAASAQSCIILYDSPDFPNVEYTHINCCLADADTPKIEVAATDKANAIFSYFHPLSKLYVCLLVRSKY